MTYPMQPMTPGLMSGVQEPEFLRCSFCPSDDLLNEEELREHEESEHSYELHDRDCGDGDVHTVTFGLKRCNLCGAEWSKD